MGGWTDKREKGSEVLAWSFCCSGIGIKKKRTEGLNKKKAGCESWSELMTWVFFYDVWAT